MNTRYSSPHCRMPAGSHRATRRAFTLIEIMIAIGIIGLLSALTGLGITRIRANARAKTCVYNQNRLFEAKRAAWADQADGDLTQVADPDNDILDYCDQNALFYCPNPGAHRPAPGVAATRANTLASYDLQSGVQTTVPTCKIDPTDHKPE